jgi:ubiquinone/menaquinone biosynthesis C-methylase UbiE
MRSRLDHYFSDMELIMGQCQRVLKPGGYCVVVIGSNTNQTGGISLENGLVEISEGIGMPLEFQIMRQIEGIRNTMRDEFLLFLRKPVLRSGVCTRARACATGKAGGGGDSESAV